MIRIRHLITITSNRKAIGLKCMCLIFPLLFLLVYLFLHLQLGSFSSIWESKNDHLGEDKWRHISRLQSLIGDLNDQLLDAVAERDFLREKVSYIVGNLTQGRRIEDLHLDSFLFGLNGAGGKPLWKRGKQSVWGCKEIDAIQITGIVKIGGKITAKGLYGTQVVAVRTVHTDIPEVTNCLKAKKYVKKEDCILLASYKLIKEILLLQELNHPNVVKMLGYCVRGEGNGQDTHDRGVTLVTEVGAPIQDYGLKTLPWKHRLKICMDLASLLCVLQQSTMGDLLLGNFTDNMFMMSEGSVRLVQVDSLVGSEPHCSSEADCQLEGPGATWSLPCSNSHCKGYNSKTNLLNVYRYFLQPLLSSSAPQQLGQKVQNLLWELDNLSLDAQGLLEKLLLLYKDEEMTDVPHPMKPAVQHDQKVGGHVEDRTPHLQGYTKLENSDYQGKFDYPCPNSRTDWGCVLTAQGLQDAISKCEKDPTCMAFVSTPHHSVEGWLTIFLKNGASDPVTNQGTTIYIKPQHAGGARLQPSVNQTAGQKHPANQDAASLFSLAGG